MDHPQSALGGYGEIMVKLYVIHFILLHLIMTMKKQFCTKIDLFDL